MSVIFAIFRVFIRRYAFYDIQLSAIQDGLLRRSKNGVLPERLQLDEEITERRMQFLKIFNSEVQL